MGQLGASPSGPRGRPHRGTEGHLGVPEVFCRHRERGDQGRSIAGPDVARDRCRTRENAPGDMATCRFSSRRIESGGLASPRSASRGFLGQISRGTPQHRDVASVTMGRETCPLVAQRSDWGSDRRAIVEGPHPSSRRRPGAPTAPRRHAERRRKRPSHDQRAVISCGRQPTQATRGPAHGTLAEAIGGELDRAFRARHGADLLRGLDLTRVLRAGAGGHLQASLAERGPGGAAPPQRQLLHQGDRRRQTSVVVVRGHGRRGPGVPQHLPAPREQAGLERLPEGGDERHLPPVRVQVPRLALRPRRLAARSCSRRSEFFDLDKADYGLVPVHCDVWEGFIFVNLAKEPEQTLPEFLGPMITKLEGYPFDRMTERLVYRARGQGATGSSSWTPSRSSTTHRFSTRTRHRPRSRPGADSRASRRRTTRIDGPHRWSARPAIRPWELPDDMLKPMERDTRSGLFGPWEVPDLDVRPDAGRHQPGEVRPLGPGFVPDLPEFRDPVLGRRTGTSRTTTGRPRQNAPRLRGHAVLRAGEDAARARRPRDGGRSFKEYGLQDANTLEATQTMLESRVRRAVPAERPGGPVPPPAQGDRGLGRRLHQKQRAEALIDGLSTLLPAEFADLEPFAATWCLATERERYAQRLAIPMDEMQAFYDAVMAARRGGDRLLRPVPARRHARRREEPAAPPVLLRHGVVPGGVLGPGSSPRHRRRLPRSAWSEPGP